MGFLKEFKDFAVKGNAVDLAIAVIIGAAFGAIISSLVAHVLLISTRRVVFLLLIKAA